MIAYGRKRPRKCREASEGREVWALDGYIGGFAEMPPVNSQIPGDTRWK